MVKLTLVEAFSALERWYRLPAEDRFAITGPIDKAYYAEVISTNPDEAILISFSNDGSAVIESDIVGIWKIQVASSTSRFVNWFSCSEIDGDDDAVKYIKDASHFKRYTSIDAKLWK